MTLKIESNPIKVKRGSLNQLLQQFRALGKYRGDKFAAFYSKNMHRLESKINSFNKHIESIRPVGDDMVAYSEAEEKVFIEYSKKTPDGKPIMRGPFSYDIDDTRKEDFDKAIKELREGEEHKTAWDKIEEFNKKRVEYLDEETDFDPHRIYEKFIPEDITGQDRYPIEDFIIEETVD